MESPTHVEFITDYITSASIPNTGAEANRQAVLRYLVDKKGWLKTDIEVGRPFKINVSNETYATKIDIVASVGGEPFMVIKCAAGSLGSREREAVSAARIINDRQIPFAAVSDGAEAIVMDALTGKPVGEGMAALFSKDAAEKALPTLSAEPLPEPRRHKECLIFRSYDSMNVNRAE